VRAYSDLAKIAYEAYGESTGSRTFDGRQMPAWDDLGANIQLAWLAAAQAVHAATRADDQADEAEQPTTLLVSDPQTPSLGRIVLVPIEPEMNNGSPVAPAIITRVWSDTTVNLRVLADSQNPPLWRTSSTYTDDLDNLDQPHLNYWTWTWQPGA
jgi:hypothetical protein